MSNEIDSYNIDGLPKIMQAAADAALDSLNPAANTTMGVLGDPIL